jgi:hypothetical protein
MAAVLSSAAPDSAVASTQRYNIYSIFHKGLRGLMADTMLRLGRMDATDACEVAQTLEQLHGLMAICRSHLQHENDLVHPALEQAKPYSSTPCANDHVDHALEIGAFEQRIAQFESMSVSERALAAHALYLDVSEFVGENFEHMKVEETTNHEVLIRHFSDQELMGIERAIVAKIPPAQSMVGMRWMIPHINAGERAFMLGGMKKNAPPEVFGRVLELAKEVLSQRDYFKLERALA